MMWALHIVAALFFSPALFVTIPAHLILNRIPARVSPEDKPRNPSDPTQKQLTDGQAFAVAVAMGFGLWVLHTAGLL